MIHKKMPFDSSPGNRLHYALGGDHEHEVKGVEFIPGTMFSEPIFPAKSSGEVLKILENNENGDTATADTSAANGGNSSATDGTTDANSSQDQKPRTKKNKAMACDWSDLDDEFEASASFHCGKGEKLFGHYVISLAPGETLTNEQWGEVLEEYMEALGYDEFCKYCGFIHNDSEKQHMHILSSRVKMEKGGPLVDDSNDYEKGFAVMRKLDKKYGLRIVANPQDSWGIDIKKAAYKYRGGNRQAVHESQMEGPKKDWAAVIRARLNKVWDEAKPRDMGELRERLRAGGVDISITTDKEGNPKGISYKAHGSDAWIAGSNVKATKLTWKNLIEKEGIKYDPNRHNEALGLPPSKDGSIVRVDAYQLLNRRQIEIIKTTKLRVRLYKQGPHYFTGFGFEQLLKTGQEKYDEMVRDQMFKLAMLIMDILFGTVDGRAQPPVIMYDGDRPEGFETVRDEVGSAADVLDVKPGKKENWKLHKKISKTISGKILNEQIEWIQPRFERIDSAPINDYKFIR